MPIRIYRVKFEEKFKGIGEWSNSELDVAVNGDATAAIKRARAHVIGQRVPISEDSKKLTPITGFKPTGVELLAESSI